MASSTKAVRPEASEKALMANQSTYGANNMYLYAHSHGPKHDSSRSGTCAVTGCGIGGTSARFGEKRLA